MTPWILVLDDDVHNLENLVRRARAALERAGLGPAAVVVEASPAWCGARERGVLERLAQPRPGAPAEVCAALTLAGATALAAPRPEAALLLFFADVQLQRERLAEIHRPGGHPLVLLATPARTVLYTAYAAHVGALFPDRARLPPPEQLLAKPALPSALDAAMDRVIARARAASPGGAPP